MSHTKLDAGRTDTLPASDPVSEFNLYRPFTMAMQADRRAELWGNGRRSDP